MIFRLIKIIICFPLDFTQRNRKHVVDCRQQSVGKQMRRTKFSTQVIIWLETKEGNSDFVNFQSLKEVFRLFWTSLLYFVNFKVHKNVTNWIVDSEFKESE